LRLLSIQTQELPMTSLASQTFGHGHGHSLSLTLGRGLRGASVWMSAVWRALTRSLQSAPASALLARGRDVQRVRALAQSWERTDPGFAADLYAAASRHEALND
jgi:hypothetical protein